MRWIVLEIVSCESAKVSAKSSSVGLCRKVDQGDFQDLSEGGFSRSGSYLVPGEVLLQRCQ